MTQLDIVCQHCQQNCDCSKKEIQQMLNKRIGAKILDVVYKDTTEGHVMFEQLSSNGRVFYMMTCVNDIFGMQSIETSVDAFERVKLSNDFVFIDKPLDTQPDTQPDTPILCVINKLLVDRSQFP